MNAPAALVLLHGFAGAPAAWDEVVASLPAELEPRALPLPGHDPFLPADPARGFGGAVETVAQAIDALGTAPVHLAGYSLGGRIALGVALARPELVCRLSLVGAHPGLPGETERAARRAADARWAHLLREAGIETFADAWDAQPLFDTQRALPAARRARHRALRLAHDPGALADAMEAMSLGAMPDMRAGLAGSRVPLDLAAGEFDARFTALAHEMAALRPGARVHIIPGSGHNPLLERPADLARMLGGPPPDEDSHR